jgi:hypothetical protein
MPSNVRINSLICRRAHSPAAHSPSPKKAENMLGEPAASQINHESAAASIATAADASITANRCAYHAN